MIEFTNGGIEIPMDKTGLRPVTVFSWESKHQVFWGVDIDLAKQRFLAEVAPNERPDLEVVSVWSGWLGDTLFMDTAFGKGIQDSIARTLESGS